MAKKAAAKKGTLPVLKKGEKYIGAILGADGKGHHIVLLPGDERGDWKAMMAAAKKRGGDLPDRVEQALLYRDHKSEFQKDWYWSNTPYAGDAGFAWDQDFGGGTQSCGNVSGSDRARAVRRVPVQ